MKIIGHRGARGLAPENTLASISHALAHHVDEVEVDARVTSDGIVILSHDPALVIGDEHIQINKHSYAELKAHKPDLTTLGEMLDLIDTKARPHIEVKPAEPTEPIISIVKSYIESGMYRSEDFLLGSKSQITLRALHRQLPEVEKVVIESWSSLRAHFRARSVGTKRISFGRRWLWTAVVRGFHKRGYKFCIYTINSKDRIAGWDQYLYGIVTDYPDLFETR